METPADELSVLAQSLRDRVTVSKPPAIRLVIPVNRITIRLPLAVTPLVAQFQGYQEINLTDDPSQARWCLVPLYQVTVAGLRMIWQIGFDGVDQLEMAHGYVGGAPPRLDRTLVEVKSQENHNQQALLQARRRYINKVKEGYMPAGAAQPTFSKGMKGVEYKPGAIKDWPVAIDPKLDGIRMLATSHGGGRIDCRSYLNNAYTHLGHITAELAEFSAHLPPYHTYDGELYQPDWTFNQLSSVVKSIKNLHPHLPQVRYYIFDLIYEPAQPFERRREVLYKAYESYLASGGTAYTFSLVRHELAYDHQQAMQWHDYYVSQGYEGIMLKKLAGSSQPGSRQYASSLYKAGKSSQILKYKAFVDEEAVIIGVKDAAGTERGAAMLTVQDIRGNVLDVRPRGSFEVRRQWLLHPEMVVGRTYTIRRASELSEYGVPRFVTGVAIRDYEGVFLDAAASELEPSQ